MAMQDFWNQRYSESEFAYGTLPNAYFKSVIDTLKPGKLLVPGAGEGRDAVYAATIGWDVFAFDQSEAGKQKALQLAMEKGVSIRYEVMDVQHFATNEKFDAIALIFFHLPPAVRQAMHLCMKGWLVPGAHVIMEAFTPSQLQNTSGGPRDLSLLITGEVLANELSYLQLLENAEIQIDLDEGKYHRGRADVVRLHGTLV